MREKVFKKKGYFYSLLLLFCGLFSLLIHPQSIEAAEDNQPPVVESISIDKREVTVGDTVTITAKVSDESKIKSVWLNFRNNTASLLDLINTDLTSVDKNTFKLSFTITENFINGTYKLSSFYSSDALGNETYG